MNIKQLMEVVEKLSNLSKEEVLELYTSAQNQVQEGETRVEKLRAERIKALEMGDESLAHDQWNSILFSTRGLRKATAARDFINDVQASLNGVNGPSYLPSSRRGLEDISPNSSTPEQ